MFENSAPNIELAVDQTWVKPSPQHGMLVKSIDDQTEVKLKGRDDLMNGDYLCRVLEGIRHKSSKSIAKPSKENEDRWARASLLANEMNLSYYVSKLIKNRLMIDNDEHDKKTPDDKNNDHEAFNEDVLTLMLVDIYNMIHDYCFFHGYVFEGHGSIYEISKKVEERQFSQLSKQTIALSKEKARIAENKAAQAKRALEYQRSREKEKIAHSLIVTCVGVLMSFLNAVDFHGFFDL